MGTVVRLPRPSEIKIWSKRSQKPELRKEAKILFFSGVRYSRYYETPVRVIAGKRD